MRKVFGYLFLVLAVVWFSSIFQVTSITQLIGHLIGWALISAIPAFLLLRSSKTKKQSKELSTEEKTESKN